jgi:hypothetical protein
MRKEININHLLQLPILHASPTASEKRVTKGTVYPEEGYHDISQSPENAAIFNDESATDLLIKQSTDVIYPDKPNTEPPNSPDEPFPEAA